MRLRKRLVELTAADLEQYPVWLSILDTYENEDDEQEEDTRWTLTPYLDAFDPTLPLVMDFVCVVAAELTLANGDILSGYLEAKGAGMTTVMDTQPVLFTSQGPVSFYSGIHVPTKEEIAKDYQLLGRSTDQVFPLRYRSKVLLSHRSKNVTHGLISDSYAGIIEGFHYMDMEPSVVKLIC